MSGCTMVLLIATSLYLQWTVIGASTYSIEGLQGRYFLPVLPFVVCAFLSTKDNSKMTKASGGMNVRVCVGGGVNLLFSLYVINLLVLMNVISYSSYVG